MILMLMQLKGAIAFLLFGDQEIVERMKAVVIKLDVKDQGTSSLKVVYLNMQMRLPWLNSQ